MCSPIYIQNNSLDKFLNLNLLDWLNYLRITIQHIECFYRRPYNKGLIHSDVNGGDFTKINYIFGGKNSYMQWYEPLAHSKGLDQRTPSGNTPYVAFAEKDVIPVSKACLTGYNLVQVGIPHTIINDSEERFCLSIVISDINKKRITMQQAQSVLKDYIIE